MAVGTTGLRPVLVDGFGGGEMSESKMREAFEVWWRAVLNDLYSEVGIDDKYIARLAWNAALAQHPAAVVELTDEEIIAEYELEMQQHLRGHEKANVIRVCRKAIAAHEAKKNGGGA